MARLYRASNGALSRLLCVKSFEHGIRGTRIAAHTVLWDLLTLVHVCLCLVAVFFSLSLLSFVVREKLTCHKFLLRNPNEQIVSSVECACIKANPKKNPTNYNVYDCAVVFVDMTPPTSFQFQHCFVFPEKLREKKMCQTINKLWLTGTVDLNGSLIKYALLFFSLSVFFVIPFRFLARRSFMHSMRCIRYDGWPVCNDHPAFIMTMNFKWWQAIKFLIEICTETNHTMCECRARVNGEAVNNDNEPYLQFELQTRRMAWIKLKYMPCAAAKWKRFVEKMAFLFVY